MLKILQEDYQNNSFRSFLILLFYRIAHYAYMNNRFILLKITNIVFFMLKICLSIQSQISYKAKIGRNIRLPHVGFGVVVSAKAVIGNNVTIYHLVTIGINEKKCLKANKNCVFIEDNCYLSTGAKIISARVRKNSVIGPNAVIYKDTLENSYVFNQVEYR